MDVHFPSKENQMENVDITIIGAGVVGLAVGAALSDPSRQVVVLEKNLAFGQESSSRNSEVIHAGLYYPPESLKARTCVRGNQMLYSFCSRHDVGCARLGKLMVAAREEEIPELERIKSRGEACGVEGLTILDRTQVARMEPHIHAQAALWSPATGIINSHELMQAYSRQIEDRGGFIVYDSEVAAVEPQSNGYVLSIAQGDYRFMSRTVINCAGLSSDRIAGLAGIDIDRVRYRLKYCKGEYFALQKKLPVKHLIYDTPRDELGLGIHLVIDLAGGMRLGPNAFTIDSLDYKIDPSHKREFHDLARRYFEGIDIEDLVPDTAGIRPQLLSGDEHGFKDFIIKEETDKGLPGFINCIGIESPGLTAAPAIAEEVARLVKASQ